jgi:glucokinase
MTANPDALVVGVDVGGTKVAAGLVTYNGEITSQVRAPMVASSGAEAGLAAVISAIDLLWQNAPQSRNRIQGIGICAPGPLDPKTGVVLNPPNIPCWRSFPLADEIEKVYRVPVKLENDANAAALAEAYWGAGRGYEHIFYTGIGTGIGTGLVCRGRIYNGRTGAAAEGGHMSIDYRGPRCGCGKPGCIEILAAGPAIARRARAELAAEGNHCSSILTLAKGNIDAVSSEIVGRAYADGDRLAKKVLQDTVRLLSVWLSNIIDLLEPDVIVIGGGVAAMLRPLFGDLANGIAEYCIIQRCREIPLLEARYGADSGIVGGAALCSECAARR